MIAVDTNLVVRLLTADDPKQSAAARSLFASGDIWISKTVLLETGWVLRSAYDMDPASVSEAFTKLLGLGNVYVEDKPCMAAALAMTDHGVDLADAMHLQSAPPGSAFLTFDREFVRSAKRAGSTTVSAIPPAVP